MNETVQEIRISPIPDNGNATPVVAEAIEKLKQLLPGESGRVVFEPGIYDFYPEGTTEREFYPSNNDGGVKRIVFPFFGLRNVIIDGGGSEFIFHGRISPAVIADCENIRFGNFILDYGTGSTGYAQGKILASDELSFELELDREEFPYRVEDGVVYFKREYDETSSRDTLPLLQEFDAKVTGPAYGQGCMFLATGKTDIDFSKMPVPVLDTVAREIRPGVLHFDNVAPDKKKHCFGVGNELILKYENRENPAVYVLNSKDVVVEDVTMYRALGMGVVAQTTENITVSRVKAVTRPGRRGLVGVGDDATHFVNCSGLVEIRDCVFEHMMDDAVNIHGIYARVAGFEGNRLTVELQHGQQQGVNVFFPGDVMEISRFGSMDPVASLKVVSSRIGENKKLVEVEFDTPVPEAVQAGDIVENPGRMPEVLITGCRMGHNRPRGILITTTKRAVIEENEFYNSQTGIHVGGDNTYWFESGRVTDLTVRNNRFVNCCYNGGDYVITIAPECRRDEDFRFHSGIVIENNVFESFWAGMVYAFSTDGLIVRNNRLIRTDAFAPRDEKDRTNLFENCPGAINEGNIFEF